MNAPSEAFLHDKLQALQAQAGDGFVAQRHHVRPQLHAHHVGRDAASLLQPVVHGKGQVALAGTEVHHAQLRGLGQA